MKAEAIVPALEVLTLLGIAVILIRWAAYYARPKCKVCPEGRLEVIGQWFGNKKYECDFCGEPYWDLED